MRSGIPAIWNDLARLCLYLVGLVLDIGFAAAKFNALSLLGVSVGRAVCYSLPFPCRFTNLM